MVDGFRLCAPSLPFGDHPGHHPSLLLVSSQLVRSSSSSASGDRLGEPGTAFAGFLSARHCAEHFPDRTLDSNTMRLVSFTDGETDLESKGHLTLKWQAGI